MGRTETVEYRRFRVIEIWELQDDFSAGRLLVPFVHMSGLHAADMHKLDLEEAFRPQKVRRRFGIKRKSLPATMPGPNSTGFLDNSAQRWTTRDHTSRQNTDFAQRKRKWRLVHIHHEGDYQPALRTFGCARRRLLIPHQPGSVHSYGTAGRN